MKSMKSTVKRMDEEAVLKILSEEAPVGICIMQDGKFCYFNSNFPIAIGYTADELVGKDPLRLIVPEDREMVKENEIKMLKGELLSPYQFRVIHKDGSIRWVMEAVRSIQYRGRRAVLGNYMEVTERKQMEETLKESEERYRELANSITDIFFAMDEHLRYTYWNKASEILTGIRAEDAIGKSLGEIFPDTPGVRNAEKVYRKVLRTQQSQTFVNDFNINGSHYIFEISAYLSRGGISVFVKDITERKEVEEALQAEKNKLQSLIDAMEYTFTIQDTEYNIIYQNEPSKIASGGDHLGEKCYRVYEGRETVCDGCPVEEAFKDGKSHTAERRTASSGKVAFWENTANPIRDAGGRIVSCLEIGRNITERKQWEQALADEATRRRILVDQSIDGIVVLDENGKVYEANQRFAEMLGYTPEEVRELHMWDWDKNFPREQLLKMVRSVDEAGDHFETYHRRKDGTVYDVEISTNGAVCAGKKLVFCVCRDITERKQAEEALRHSEEKHKVLFNSSVIGMFVMDAETMKMVMCNQAAAKMFGFSSVEEAIGINPLDFVLPEDKEKVLEVTTKEMFEQDLRRTHEYRVVNKDSRERWVSVTGARIMHEGRLAGLVSITDITERKQAVEALRQSEERHRTILEEMEDAYSEVDLAGNLTFVNNSVCRDLGYSIEELIGKRMNYKGFTVEEDIESVFRVFNEVYRTGVPNKGFSWRTIRKDGSHGFAETSVAPLRNGKGEIIGFRGVGRDIAERKQAEEALRQSEERYRTILEEMEDSYFEVDLGGHLTFVNNSMCRDLGYSVEELIGRRMSYKGFTVEEGIESVFRVFNEVYRTGVPNKGFPWKIIRKDGTQGFTETAVSPLRNDNGEIIGFRGTGRDVTERKKMEEALRQSEEKYRTILEEMEDSYFEVDLGGHFTFANSSTCRNLGYSREELFGMSYKNFTAEDDIESVFRVFNEVYQTGVPNKGFPWKIIRKDGTRGFAEASVSPLRNDNGEIIGFRGVGRDVTERQKMEEALRQNEENYRALFDSSVIGMLVLDAETMKVVMANKAAAKIFGFSSVEEGIGANPLDFVPLEDREGVLEFIVKELFEQDLRQPHELQAITKDGRKIWVSITGARIMHEGKLAGLISFTDITEQKQQNERLMLTDRLASLGELASGAAHELNNPLTSIIGFSQLLMEKEVPDDIREDLKLIYSEAQRAASVTKNLLTFARKHAPVKQRDQINNIIEDVLKLRTYEHKVSGIEVEGQLDPDLPKIMVDYFQMQQVFMNIIINAEYFMTKAHNKGTLTITTKKQSNTVMISIADDGPGIPPENLKRIFDPFFTTKEAGKGTGLGLSICHGIVTEHGGQIYARSQLGKGATIFVELPINSRDHIGDMFKTG